MKQIVDQKTTGNIRVTVFDDDTARVDGLVSAEIVNVNMDRPQENSNGKVFYIATVKTTDGETGRAAISESLLLNENLPHGRFAPGKTVRVAIQLKGAYKGNAIIEVNEEDNSKISAKNIRKKDGGRVSMERTKEKVLTDVQLTELKKSPDSPLDKTHGSPIKTTVKEKKMPVSGWMAITVILFGCWFVAEFISSKGSIGAGFIAIAQNIIGLCIFLFVALFIRGVYETFNE